MGRNRRKHMSNNRRTLVRVNGVQGVKGKGVRDCPKKINSVFPVRMQVDSDGRYVPFCNFSKKSGVVRTPQVCEADDCQYYERLHVKLDNGQEAEASWAVLESSLQDGRNGHGLRIAYCGKRKTQILLIEPRRDMDNKKYLAFCDFSGLPAIPLGEGVCLGGCCDCYKGLYIGGNGKN